MNELVTATVVIIPIPADPSGVVGGINLSQLAYFTNAPDDSTLTLHFCGLVSPLVINGAARVKAILALMTTAEAE